MIELRASARYHQYRKLVVLLYQNQLHALDAFAYLSGARLYSGESFDFTAQNSVGVSFAYYSGNNFTFGSSTVPAPSALALIGFAGVATRRRRR